MRWRVTVRHGSEVDKQSFELLEQALTEARGRAAAVLSEGRLGTISAFREHTPDTRVQARIEVSGKGLRGPEAGIDVMGDGSLVPYRGAIFKRRLRAGSLEEAVERLRESLSE